ncbi:MAG: hypothetical protein DYG89_43200 [Caldilinea sp. CFX5]|nr:hypothetical protein [Caldilinea sp. CFX5]
MTWPLAAQMGRQIPADTGSDVWVHEWTFWWLNHALTTGQNPYFTPLLFHPTGVELTSHNIAWLNFALWWPLQALVGGNAALSLTYLLCFTLNAFAMYCFAYEQAPSRAAAWLAGLVFGFWPYTLAQAGHPNMIVLFGLPVGLLYLGRALKGGTGRQAVAAGLGLALVGIARWQLLVPAAYLFVIFVLAQLATRRALWSGFTLKQLLITGTAMLLGMAPLLGPVVLAQVTRPAGADLLTYEPQYASDLASYFMPHQQLWLWSAVAERLPPALQFPQQEITFIGYTVTFLLLIGLLGAGRQALPWLIMAVVLLLLALGPVITVGRHALPELFTPYRWVEDWFFTRLLRRPDRFNSFLGFPLAMLAALGIMSLQRQLPATLAKLWTPLLTLGLAAEYSQVPYPLTNTTAPAWYRTLAHEPEPFAIVGFPMNPYYADKVYMHYQTVHGKPLVGGHVSRRPKDAYAYIENSPWLYELLYSRIMNPAVRDVSRQLRYLADANVRYVVFNKRFVTEGRIGDWKAWLLLKPRYEDADVAVYTTMPRAGLDFTIAQPLTQEIGIIQSAVRTATAQQGDLVTIDIAWGTHQAVAGDYAACFQLIDAQEQIGQESCYPISPAWPTARWLAHEVVRDQFALALRPDLPAGAYQLALRLQATTSPGRSQPVILGALAITALARTFTEPSPQVRTALQVGDAITLLGYDLTVNDTIRLTLYWQARTAIDRSYKIFVHLVDPASNTIVAQSDAAPRQWAYPTTWWQAGEVVTETIDLPLDATATGANLLRVGMYDEETGARLLMQDQNRVAVPDNALAIKLRQPTRNVGE